jgi:molecular chaperone GrpE
MTGDNEFEGGAGQPGTATPPGAANNNEAVGGAAQPQGTADETAALKTEVAELKDRLLRVQAEMDNVRKRLEREKAEQAKFAITKFARDVLGVGDNVQRAIEAVPKASLEHDPVLKSFFEGVTMIERELLAVFGRHGIKRLDPKGEPFDPNYHQAVVEVPDEEVPAGCVAQVFQSGYQLEERVLRPAMVAVSSGGSKAKAEAAGGQAGEPGDGNGTAQG